MFTKIFISVFYDIMWFISDKFCVNIGRVTKDIGFHTIKL
jgi:hypothetical protein